MKPIVVHPDAADEARDAVAYYENFRVELGEDFRTELGIAFSRIRQNPLMYAAESGTLRACPLQRFPYSILYEELAAHIWIAAVAHQKRRPGYWSRRRPS